MDSLYVIIIVSLLVLAHVGLFLAFRYWAGGGVALRPAKESPEEMWQPTLKYALRNTTIWSRIRETLQTSPVSSPDSLGAIEEILYTSDLGPKTVEALMEGLRSTLQKGDLSNLESLKSSLCDSMERILDKAEGRKSDSQRLSSSLDAATELEQIRKMSVSQGPFVLLMVGVNGVGKTTTIGKISSLFAQNGKRVLVAAGDTFRAAAEKQLKVWTERAQVEIFAPEGVVDPSAVAFDAVAKAQAKAYDVVIVDTAGRLHNQAHLMEELKKMKRVMAKVTPDAPHETWIVLDANNGQNALVQAREFHNAIQLTGVILTKMDGTAKGGVVISLANELQIPIRFLGVGERIQDLKVFDPRAFVSAILGNPS